MLCVMVCTILEFISIICLNFTYCAFSNLGIPDDRPLIDGDIINVDVTVSCKIVFLLFFSRQFDTNNEDLLKFVP
jgi:hypothetical protein